MLDGRVEDDVRLAHPHPNATRTGEKRSIDTVGDRAGETLQQKPRRPAEDLFHELGDASVVDGLLDAVARGRILVQLRPEIDEKALSEPPLLLEVAVAAEDDQTRRARWSCVDRSPLDGGGNGERLDRLAHVV